MPGAPGNWYKLQSTSTRAGSPSGVVGRITKFNFPEALA
jgi:hypothetical protein